MYPPIYGFAHASLPAKVPFPKYYDYSEEHDFEKEISFVYAETFGEESPVPLPIGLVDRVRALLTEAEKAETADLEGMLTSPVSSGRNSITGENSLFGDVTGSMISSPTVKRITREMILAALAPSSSHLDTSAGTANDSEVPEPGENADKLDLEIPPILDTDAEDYQSCASGQVIETDEDSHEGEDEILEFAKNYGPQKSTSLVLLNRESSKMSDGRKRRLFVDEVDVVDFAATGSHSRPNLRLRFPTLLPLPR